MQKNKLTDAAIDIIDSYVDKGIVKSDFYRDLYSSRCTDDLVKTLRSLYYFDGKKADRVFLHLIYNVFVSPSDDPDLRSYLDQKEWALFKSLVINNGVLSRSKILKWSLPARWNRALKNLEEMDLIRVLPTDGKDSIIIIDLEFMNEVRD